MSQYSFSYNYDSLNDAYNAVNRKGKMQKRYLSSQYLDAAQEYREMRKELNEILRKKRQSVQRKKQIRLISWSNWWRIMLRSRKTYYKCILTKYLQRFYQVVFVSPSLQMHQKIHKNLFTLLEIHLKNFLQCKPFAEMWRNYLKSLCQVVMRYFLS